MYWDCLHNIKFNTPVQSLSRYPRNEKRAILNSLFLHLGLATFTRELIPSSGWATGRQYQDSSPKGGINPLRRAYEAAS
jgi:hypothetical protein